MRPPEEEPMCPRCGELRQIEWDPVLRRWFCVVCSRTWARSVYGEARKLADMRVSIWLRSARKAR
jgi:hypothetical protein